MRSTFLIYIALLVVQASALKAFQPLENSLIPLPSLSATSPVDLVRKPEFAVDGTSSIPTSVMNLVKNIIGAGVLSLPAGIVVYGSHPKAVVPAIILTFIMGALAAYSFAIIGKVCEITGATTYQEAVERTIGSNWAQLAGVACTMKTFTACLAYSIIIGDLSASVYSKLLSLYPTLPPLTRNQLLIAISTAVIFPLNLFKDFSFLSYTSFLGIFATLMTGGIMIYRYLDGSYVYPDGAFLTDLAAKDIPSFGPWVVRDVFSLRAFVLLSMLSTAYISHYNAPRYYLGLQNRSLPRFNQMVTYAFGLAAFISVLIMSAGFLIFGSRAKGLILNNFASTDNLMNLGRAAIMLSVVFGYPLTFAGLRDGFFALLKMNGRDVSNTVHFGATTMFMLTLTYLAMVLNDLGFVVSFGGAILGTLVIYIFPSLMLRSVAQDKLKSSFLTLDERAVWQSEVSTSSGMLVLGVILSIVGGLVSVLKTFTDFFK